VRLQKLRGGGRLVSSSECAIPLRIVVVRVDHRSFPSAGQNGPIVLERHRHHATPAASCFLGAPRRRAPGGSRARVAAREVADHTLWPVLHREPSEWLPIFPAPIINSCHSGQLAPAGCSARRHLRIAQRLRPTSRGDPDREETQMNYRPWVERVCEFSELCFGTMTFVARDVQAIGA